jgi:hypothetical protein
MFVGHLGFPSVNCLLISFVHFYIWIFLSISSWLLSFIYFFEQKEILVGFDQEFFILE